MGAPVDDFKTSTRAMLEVVRGEKARLKKRMDELDEREKIILKWIEQEEGPQPELPIPPGRVRLRLRPSLKELLREVMQDGKPRTNAELAEVAKLRGLVDDDVDLRTINSTMLSLMNGGEPLLRREDKWILKVKPMEERA
jgi:hypothetical protein